MGIRAHVRGRRGGHRPASPTRRDVREAYGLAGHRAGRRPAWRSGRRQRDPVRRGVGLRDLRRLRRGLPGHHRARRQDRRACGATWSSRTAGSRRSSPRRSAAWRASPTRGASRRPRASTGRRACPFKVRTVAEVKAAGQLDGLEVLYWVGCAAAFDDRNKRVARAVATCLDAAGDLVSRSWARRRPARATRPAGWATSTCSRSWPARTSRRSTGTGSGSGRSSPRARTASTPSATSTASWAARSRSATTASSSRTWSRTDGWSSARTACRAAP